MDQKLVAVALPLLAFAVVVGALVLARRAPSRLSLNAWSSLLLLGYLLTTAGLGIFWVANQQLPVFDWHYLFGYGTVLLALLHLTFNLPTAWRWITRRKGSAHLRRAARLASRARSAGSPHAARTPRLALPPSPASGRGSQCPLPPATTGRAQRPLPLAGEGGGERRRHAETPRRRALAVAAGVSALAAFAGGAIGFVLGRRHPEPVDAPREAIPLPASDGRDPAALGRAASLAVVERFHAFSSHSRSSLVLRAPNLAWRAAPPAFKSYPASDSAALPAPAAGATRAALDRQALATALWHTSGITESRGGLDLRASPSSGALFSTELYVAARAVSGLAAGLWHYDPQRHALARIAGAGAIDAIAAAAAPAGGDAGALAADGAVVVATVVYGRTGRKYGDRTYRYLLADLGHALENLRLAAGAAGLSARFITGFDEARATAALGIDPKIEGALAMVALQPAIANAPTAAASASAGPPPGAGSGSPILRTIASRRSIRRFAGSDLPASALLGTLADATAADGAGRSSALRIDVVAHAVGGVARGTYRFDPVRNALVAKQGAEAPSRPASRAAALDQDVIGDAQAVLVFSIERLAFAADALGAAYGYRHAFLEAGRVGERVYLAAVARGLGCCGVGAFYDDEAARLVGVDPMREWIVHFIALGVPSG